MPLFSFFLHYFLHVLFGALIIGGFFCITRGHEEVMPDGTIAKRGKILKGWYFFWYKERLNKIKLFYAHAELRKTVASVTANVPGWKPIVVNYGDSYIEVSGIPAATWALDVETRLNVKVAVNNIPNGSRIYFYREVPDYVYPGWVRDMLAGCVTCHSSWLGSICFWLPFLLSKQYCVMFECFQFTDHYLLALLLTWVAYCFTQAFVVTALWRKYM